LDDDDTDEASGVGVGLFPCMLLLGLVYRFSRLPPRPASANPDRRRCPSLPTARMLESPLLRVGGCPTAALPMLSMVLAVLLLEVG
jgi:hypothetical protein